MIRVGKHFESGFYLEAEGEGIKDCMQAFSDAAATEFLTEAECGVCKCRDIFPNVRTVPDPSDKKGKATFTYPELKCSKVGCWAALELGQKKDGTLYPKRKDKDGGWLPNRGWKRYTKETADRDDK